MKKNTAIKFKDYLPLYGDTSQDYLFPNPETELNQTWANQLYISDWANFIKKLSEKNTSDDVIKFIRDTYDEFQGNKLTWIDKTLLNMRLHHPAYPALYREPIEKNLRDWRDTAVRRGEKPETSGTPQTEQEIKIFIKQNLINYQEFCSRIAPGELSQPVTQTKSPKIKNIPLFSTYFNDERLPELCKQIFNTDKPRDYAIMLCVLFEFKVIEKPINRTSFYKSWYAFIGGACPKNNNFTAINKNMEEDETGYLYTKKTYDYLPLRKKFNEGFNLITTKG